MINVINNWESTDLQRKDSLIRAARLSVSLGSNPGSAGFEDPTALAARDRPQRPHQSSHSHPRSGSNPPYDWTNTKGRTDVCYRCGLPGHFAQYCISEMPDDIRRHIVRDRKEKANIAADSDSDSDAKHAHFAMTDHFAAAALDLPSELNLDTMDHETSIGFVNSHPNTVHIPPISVADFEAGHTDKLHATLLAHVQAQSSSLSSATGACDPHRPLSCLYPSVHASVEEEEEEEEERSRLSAILAASSLGAISDAWAHSFGRRGRVLDVGVQGVSRLRECVGVNRAEIVIDRLSRMSHHFYTLSLTIAVSRLARPRLPAS
ncbi:hypothetical protein B0H14DRAFT_318868 [Mycena olivaceomarginata]|nr:hypothetical protein B0H14DRAFT_318868 [Mycena olivaceomarginata]